MSDTSPEAVERHCDQIKKAGRNGSLSIGYASGLCATLRAQSAERDALKAELAEAVEAIQFAANRLEMIADDGWNGDARDFKRSLVGVLSEARAFLARHQKETDT